VRCGSTGMDRRMIRRSGIDRSLVIQAAHGQIHGAGP
jgi:hypothetical protein